MKKFITALVVALMFTSFSPVMANENLSIGGIPDSISNIVIFIRFNGEEEFLNEENSRMIESTYNQFIDANNDKIADKGSVSLKSYINDLTYGKSTINTNFYPANTGENKYYSLVTENNKQYYLDKPMGGDEENKIIKWAFDSVKNQINLSSDELDRNGDGQIDNVTFVFNGEANSNNTMLWPHKTVFKGEAELKGKKLTSYNIVNSGNAESNIFNKASLETIIHEFLHLYYFPDLYRIYGNRRPVGMWDIMANTLTPGQMPLVYTKEHYGKIGLNIGEIKEDGTYELKKSNSGNKEDRVAYKIKSPLSDTEYFMVEFKKAEGNWDSRLPGSGLIVYRIDDKVNDLRGNIYGSPDHIYIFRPGDTDGRSAIGDVSNVFLSKESLRDKIGNADIDSGFNSNAIYFQDGSNSGIEIYNIGSSAKDTISFSVKLPNITEDGSKENPYKIYNAEGLKRISNKLDKHYILMDNIDLSNIEWNPIGIGLRLDSYNSFTGSLNGNGHTISNMKIVSNSEKAYVGLFSSIGETAEIHDLNLENININSNGTIGGLAAENKGKVRNIKISGNINSTSIKGNNIIGDVIGIENKETSLLENITSSVKINLESGSKEPLKPETTTENKEVTKPADNIEDKEVTKLVDDIVDKEEVAVENIQQNTVENEEKTTIQKKEEKKEAPVISNKNPNNNNEKDKIPYTGGTNTNIVLICALILVITGILVLKKKRYVCKH
ncbi:hypothetical protein JCM1393_06500 [Clostridium carnis]